MNDPMIDSREGFSFEEEMHAQYLEWIRQDIEDDFNRQLGEPLDDENHD